MGVVLGLVAIWVDFGPTSYWSYDGSLGGLLLILGLGAALALIAAFMTNERDFDIAYGALGGVGFGIYLFYPAIFAFDQWDQLDSGAWLGLCSGLTFIGAAIATWSGARALRRPSPVGAVTALVGCGLVIAGLFPSFFRGGGSYWSITGYGHSFGILMIILVVLEALAIFAAWQSSAGIDSAVMVGGIILGAAIALPDQSAFNHFGDLGTGGWLTGVGGLLVAIGVLVLWLGSDEAAPESVPSTAPPAAPTT